MQMNKNLMWEQTTNTESTTVHPLIAAAGLFDSNRLGPQADVESSASDRELWCNFLTEPSDCLIGGWSSLWITRLVCKVINESECHT